MNAKNKWWAESLEHNRLLFFKNINIKTVEKYWLKTNLAEGKYLEFSFYHLSFLDSKSSRFIWGENRGWFFVCLLR